MTEFDEADIHAQINRAIAAQAGDQLVPASLRLDSLVQDQDCFSECSFAFLLALLNRPDFLNLDGSYFLLYVFDIEWELLSARQKERLLPVLESSYARFVGHMACFQISVLLGEHYKNAAALQVLIRLKGVADEDKRWTVSHGLAHLVDSSGDAALAQAAYAELMQMRTDPSPYVRDVVTKYLRELANAGYQYDRS